MSAYGEYGQTRRRRATGPVGVIRRPLLHVAIIGVVALVLAPCAQASSGRMLPRGQHHLPGQTLRVVKHLAGSATEYSLWDAQPGGALIGAWDSKVTLDATDDTGRTVWSVDGQDVWTASGVLPAGMAAVFDAPNPNVPRSGKLVAYRADGSLRFHRFFRSAFVLPLCDTTRRLVWVEVTARPAMRLFVRQGGVTRSLAVPYTARRPGFPSPAACSADGSTVALGSFAPGSNAWRDHVSWIRIDRRGVPRIVSQRVTSWIDVSLSPGGVWAAATTATGDKNVWLRSGRFTGRPLPGEDTGVMAVGRHSIFELGEYSYSNGKSSWGTTTVNVVDRPYLRMFYQRAWVTDGEHSVWFENDPDINWLASLDAAPGSLTVINLMTWDSAAVPTTYVDAIPVRGGELAVLAADGTLGYIANPVPNP